MSRRHRVYGPVPSRRFGLSLGIDIVPYKSCPYDCVYCQLGPTDRLGTQREAFFPVSEILADVSEALARGPRPEVLTLAGSGEPTLHAGLGDVIDGLHALCGIPVLLLTNGSLLHLPEVREACKKADIFVPSLDAADPGTFARINGPHPSLDFATLMEGLRLACADHPGVVRLEVMLVPGLNDHETSLAALADRVAELPVTSVDLNTPVRPAPGRPWVKPFSPEELQAFAVRLGPKARVVASWARPRAASEGRGDAETAVLDLLARRPCTLGQMGSTLGLPAEDLASAVARLEQEGSIRWTDQGGERYWVK